MDQADQLLAVNAELASSAPGSPLAAPPTRQVSIVTCMDARFDVYAALGLKLGEAHVIRNAGGVVTDDVIRSLAISQRRLGTTAVLVIHHTHCGMQSLDEEELRGELQRAAGTEPSFALQGFADLETDVRESVIRLRDCPYLPHRDQIRGFVFDVDTARLREIEL